VKLGRWLSACVLGFVLVAARGPLCAQPPGEVSIGIEGPVPAPTPWPQSDVSAGPPLDEPWSASAVPWGATLYQDDGRPRHVGRGHPLEGTSWLNRPLSAGWFIGGLVGDDLVDDQISMHSDFLTGIRLGWDFEHFWGTEIRLGWSEVELSDVNQPPRPRPGNFFIADVNYLRYFWGDSQVRPFWSLGLGLSTFNFEDSSGLGYNESLVTFPLGVGVKYQPRPWMAARVDLQDNVTIAGGGLDAMQNFTFSVGAEMRFGSRPRSYWPWHPSRKVW
jgi:hypothetical protein